MKSPQDESLDNIRHSTAHLLAAAVLELWPHAKPTIGPPTEDGFYYDFDMGDVRLSETDLPRIEDRMREIVATWEAFKKIDVTTDEALERYGGNEYKRELIDEIDTEGQPLTLYQSGSFIDLCRGGHVSNPSKSLKHFKLLSIAGAYWRGDETNTMLTRIYGTAFPSRESLDQYLAMREEAKKRDHRKIGAELELYFIDETVGKGLVMWLPKGTIVRDQIESLAREYEGRYGYERVVTPHIARQELFLTSGHLPYYKDSMFPAMEMDDGTYYLKAMNCPHHHRIYLHKPRSYRDLPIRLAEYGTCYRNELSGTLSGLLRVRGLAMNDAHIYCRKDQIKSEFRRVIELTLEYFRIFRLKQYWFRLSRWDPEHKDKYIDEPEHWDFCEQTLREVLIDMSLEYREAVNEAAFYGPKVDVQCTSVTGREETMSTIQLDFAAMRRFQLTYTDESGSANGDVFVIHRAPLSVHERFLAFLIEHYAGAFPTWLAPVQIALLPIGDKHKAYAEAAAETLRQKGIRVEVDAGARSIGAKIRLHTLQKVPYMGIMGDKEVSAHTITVRNRRGEDQGQYSTEALVQQLLSEIENRS